MSRRRPRTILLTGAPSAVALQAKAEGLLDDLLPNFRTVVDGVPLECKSNACLSQAFPVWRIITLERADDDEMHDSRQPTDGPDRSKCVERRDDVKFLEHILNAIPDVAESEVSLLDDTSEWRDLSMTSNCTPTDKLSFVTAVTDSFHSFDLDTSALLTRLPVTDFRALPTHQELLRLRPQTVTANLLASIISVSPPRTVHVARKWGARNKEPMEIVELVLGDETATGFGLTFWLVPTTAFEAQPAAKQYIAAEQLRLRQILLRLRAGDVILLSHVALTSFRSKVYGQSLRARFKDGIATRIFTIEQDLDIGDCTNAQKLSRLRKWTSDFIGPPVRRPKRAHEDQAAGRFTRRIRLADELPDDTQ